MSLPISMEKNMAAERDDRFRAPTATPPRQISQQAKPLLRRPAAAAAAYPPALRKAPRPGQISRYNGSVRARPHQGPAAAATTVVCPAQISISALHALDAGYAAAEARKQAVQCGVMPARACVYKRKEYCKRGPVPVLRPVTMQPRVAAAVDGAFSLAKVHSGRVEKARVLSPKEKLAEERRKEAFASKAAALKKEEVDREMTEVVTKEREWGVSKKKLVPVHQRSLMQRLQAGKAKNFAPKRM